MIELLARLDRKRFRVHPVCFHSEGIWFKRVAELGDPVALFPIHGFRRPDTARQLLAFAWWCRTHQIEVLQTCELYSNVFGLPGGALASVPLRIGSRRGFVEPAGLQRLQRASYSKAQFVVANSQAAADQLRLEQVDEEKIVVIPNGIDPAAYPARPTPVAPLASRSWRAFAKRSALTSSSPPFRRSWRDARTRDSSSPVTARAARTWRHSRENWGCSRKSNFSVIATTSRQCCRRRTFSCCPRDPKRSRTRSWKPWPPACRSLPAMSGVFPSSWKTVAPVISCRRVMPRLWLVPSPGCSSNRSGWRSSVAQRDAKSSKRTHSIGWSISFRKLLRKRAGRTSTRDSACHEPCQAVVKNTLMNTYLASRLSAHPQGHVLAFRAQSPNGTELPPGEKPGRGLFERHAGGVPKQMRF